MGNDFTTRALGEGADRICRRVGNPTSPAGDSITVPTGSCPAASSTRNPAVTGVATLYYVMSMGIHMAMLMRTRVRLKCGYRDRFTCAQRAEI